MGNTAPSSAPATPPISAPMAKVAMRTFSRSMPISAAASRFCAMARMARPRRERCSTSQTKAQPASVAARMTS
ncbi:hypothetical protein HMPREF9946_03022 [Acetobacteraceae bacterium AT-5844]|nr:hypothetical protein HMPREF9946_03022 [Acetobacteraceae bacterium AT-5844]